MKLKSVILGLLIASSMSTTAFAMETIKINGYPHYEVGYEQITAEFQVSISNVVKVEESNSGYADDTYYCQGTVEVVALDELSGFGVSKMDKIDDEQYIETEYLVPDGYTEEEWYNRLDEDKPVEKGTKYTLKEPGVYYVYGNYGPLDGGVNSKVIIEKASTEETKPVVKENKEAIYTNSNVVVNGNKIEFEAYNIAGNNNFKLRDFAIDVAGSESQFDVTWDNEKQIINLISGKNYSLINQDKILKGDGKNKKATLYQNGILKDGVAVDVEAYTINNNNYFKLRDLCELFNVALEWDAENNVISIFTNK